jgi:uncharacterized protein YqhQ
MTARRRRLPLRLLLTMAAAEMAKPAIGGQAVLEGVMMRSPKSFAIAVRHPNGSIIVREEAWLSLSARFPFLRWPLLRGANMLIESMWNGMSALNFSAEVAMEAEAERDAKERQERGEAPVVDDTARSSSDKSGKLALAITLATSMVLAIVIFKGAPHLLTYGLGLLLGGEQTALPLDGALFHLVDGTIKLMMFAGYIFLIGRLPDVKRLFMYHGAEHMSVHTYEAEEPLDVEHTRVKTTAHPRCGTTLILLVIATSILVFVAIIPFIPRVSDSDLIQSLFALALKIPLMLPVAGLAYEAQRASAKNPNNMLVKLFIAPGMLMQKLTTRVPGDRELEVALTALRKTVWREEQERTGVHVAHDARGPVAVERYQSFDDVLKAA